MVEVNCETDFGQKRNLILCEDLCLQALQLTQLTCPVKIAEQVLE